MKIISKDNFKEHLRRKFLNKKSTWHIGFLALFIALFIHIIYLLAFKIMPLNKGNWSERPKLLWVDVQKDLSVKNQKKPK